MILSGILILTAAAHCLTITLSTVLARSAELSKLPLSFLTLELSLMRCVSVMLADDAVCHSLHAQLVGRQQQTATPRLHHAAPLALLQNLLAQDLGEHQLSVTQELRDEFRERLQDRLVQLHAEGKQHAWRQNGLL